MNNSTPRQIAQQNPMSFVVIDRSSQQVLLVAATEDDAITEGEVIRKRYGVGIAIVRGQDLRPNMDVMAVLARR